MESIQSYFLIALAVEYQIMRCAVLNNCWLFKLDPSSQKLSWINWLWRWPESRISSATSYSKLIHIQVIAWRSSIPISNLSLAVNSKSSIARIFAARQEDWKIQIWDLLVGNMHQRRAVRWFNLRRHSSDREPNDRGTSIWMRRGLSRAGSNCKFSIQSHFGQNLKGRN